MPRQRRIPSYLHHKASGQARVRINGKDHWLGKYGTPESHERYDELISEYVIGQQPTVCKTLTAVLSAWWPECKRRYRAGKGKYGGAVSWRPVIRLLRESEFGSQPVNRLEPRGLRLLIEEEARKKDWSLGYTKSALAKVKRILKWALAEGLVDVSTYHKILVVEIRDGRTSKPIPPVSDEIVEQTIPYLAPVVQAMVRFQRLTGARPGEVVIMRPGDVDRSSDVWTYVPSKHKTEHRGKSRTIYIGPQAQLVLAPWLLKAREFVFTSRIYKPYSSDSYRRHIQRRCDENGIPRWAPNQLRKAAATAIRAAVDVEAAAAVLGHSSSVVTADHYAAVTKQRALETVKRFG